MEEDKVLNERSAQLDLDRRRGERAVLVSSESPDAVSVSVVLLSGQRVCEVKVDGQWLVLDLKAFVVESAQTPIQYQRLVCLRELRDEAFLMDEITPRCAGEGIQVCLVRVNADPCPRLLEKAVSDGDVVLARYLLDFQTCPNGRLVNLDTLLIVAVRMGSLTLCNLLLTFPEFNMINAKNKSGRTALHYAGERGHAQICVLLLDHPDFSEANAVDKEGWTALHYAAIHGHVDSCRVISGHEKFTEVDALDSDGDSAARLAESHRHFAAAEAIRPSRCPCRPRNGLRGSLSNFRLEGAL